MLLSAPAQALDWHQPWAAPRDPVAARECSDEYAWRLFVALDWPADPVARKAQPDGAFGADRPVVWETWQTPAEVYLKDGSDPGPWRPRVREFTLAPEQRFESTSLQGLSNARHIVAGVMVPFSDSVATGKRLTEVRLNRLTFDYIRSRELYNVEGQERAVTDGEAVYFPHGAMEVKAKWRLIDPADRSRYHTLRIVLPDGTPRWYGLTALHIAAKELPNWFWATFEQVDNPKQPDSEGWQLSSRDTFACGLSRPDCNAIPRGVGLDGTVWQYYRLRGTLTAFVDGSGNPRRLANSELEAGFQASSSCMTCHARATIGVVAGHSLRLPVFDAVADAASTLVDARRGFVGLPQRTWFAADGGSDPQFKQLDFVWSLSLAHSRSAAGSILVDGGNLNE